MISWPHCFGPGRWHIIAEACDGAKERERKGQGPTILQGTPQVLRTSHFLNVILPCNSGTPRTKPLSHGPLGDTYHLDSSSHVAILELCCGCVLLLISREVPCTVWQSLHWSYSDDFLALAAVPVHHGLGNTSTRHILLMVLEAGRPRTRCLHGCVLGRTRSLIWVADC